MLHGKRRGRTEATTGNRLQVLTVHSEPLEVLPGPHLKVLHSNSNEKEQKQGASRRMKHIGTLHIWKVLSTGGCLWGPRC